MFRPLLLCTLLALPITAQEAPQRGGVHAVRTVHDPQDHLSFEIPSNWTLATHDRELSTFHQEARTAPISARIRYVAAMPENPFPVSTFSGAHFYLSVTPRQTEAQCASQTTAAAGHGTLVKDVAAIDHLPASHMHDEHGTTCTQFRDDVYVVRRRGVCIRFDLAMNNFCGGEVSGARDMSPAEVQSIRHELEVILNSVSFER